MQLILLFPGQGSQQPGMARDIHDAFASARAIFDEASSAASTDLRRVCFDLDADTLRETQNAQLALLAHGAAVFAALRESGLATRTVACAGHSVGEYAAFHAAGSLSLGTVAKLVEVRGRSMAESGRNAPGTMAAILGTPGRPIEDICREASQPESQVVPANFNAPEQVVISGHVDAVERGMQLALAAGAKRATRLNVSGAFHSPLMQPALGELTSALAGAEFSNADMPVFANVTATACSSAEEARALLGRQLTSPVRWVELMRGIERAHPTALCLEMGPGNVLAGLVKRCAPSLKTLPCGTVADIDALNKVLA